MCMEKLVGDPVALTRYSNVQLVDLAGSQGVEILMWLAARGALTGDVSSVHSNYHIPISNTASGLMVMENHSVLARGRLDAVLEASDGRPGHR